MWMSCAKDIWPRHSYRPMSLMRIRQSERPEREWKCAQPHITRKTMPHKLEAMKDKTTADRSSSIILLPADWAMLRVAKLLHCFAPRYVPCRINNLA